MTPGMNGLASQRSTPVPAPQPLKNDFMKAPTPNETGPRPKTKAQPGQSAPQEVVNLDFNVAATPWNGDLGAYLLENVPVGTKRATVMVRGSGVLAMSPVKLPDGLSLGLFGDANEGTRLTPATFVPKPGSSGKVMLELVGGDLAITNLAFLTEVPTNRPLHWVKVTDGLLGVRHCRFRDSVMGSAVVGAIVAFQATSSSPIPARLGPFTSSTDRPTAILKNCLIWTTGEAILAELGRGVVNLDNCLLITGTSAMTLLPASVSRETFEADLVLERCTIAPERYAIQVGPWSGDPRGPARPWLISSRRCVFPRTQTSNAGALLLADNSALASCALFWQSTADTYDVSRFLTTSDVPPANPPAADLTKQWVDLWGRAHTKNDQGPNPRRNESVLRYKDKEKPRPGKVLPLALELDPKAHKDDGVDLIHLPLSR